MKRSWTLLFALAVAACNKPTGPGPGSETPPGPAPAREVKGTWVEAQRGLLRKVLPTIGDLRPRRTAILGSQVSGRVLEVLVDVGDPVVEKQELVRLDPVMFELELAEQQADLDWAKVAKAEAELNFTRMKGLWEKPEGQEPSIPRKLFDDAKMRLEAASAQVAQEDSKLRTALERRREAVVCAPFAGVVSARFVDPGEPVTFPPVTHLLEIQEVSTLELEFSLSQELMGSVSRGTRVTFEVEGLAGVVTETSVDVVYPAVDEETRSFRCRALVNNAKGKLRPGLLARVHVTEREIPDALIVPWKALRRGSSGWHLLVSADGVAVERPVVVGLESEEGVEIREGLKEGEKVLLPESK